MENPQPSPDTSVTSDPRRCLSRRVRRVLLTLLVAAGALGTVWLMLPAQRDGTRAPGPPRPPVPAPGVAPAVVDAGVPASLPGPTALIIQRQRHLRARPSDAGAWAVLGAAHVERGRRAAGVAPAR
ncbi:hypothetical protein ACIOC2_02605 [Streptomyces sp. NPDC088337]|uniref:hypothetical protein n=1 Tax=unclassified Streptomyces TaxID=2593676 RepID=UPI002DDC5B34|nr:hypothetical protein [Streptomyces sp. NBC_01788]WSB26971.1 hypothetical protein OIE49_14320 [Streptomyces sp. NBC_01788]